MAGPNDKQNKNIARAKLRQQQEAERAAKAAAQKRARVTALAVAAVLVVGGAFGAVQLLGNDNPDTVSATDDPSNAPDDLVKDTTPPAPPGKENCVYASEDTEDTGGRKVSKPPLIAEATEPYKVTIKTNKGDIKLTLNSSEAPCTVNSFVHLARAKFYDNTVCHRALLDDGYGVLQCGDPTGTGSGGSGYSFRDENLEGASYKKGVVAMANPGVANKNGSQFFMVFKDSAFPASYTPFGTIDGQSSFDTLTAIAKDGTVKSDLGYKDKPAKTVKVEKVTVTSGPAESASATSEPTGKPSDEPSSEPSSKESSKPTSTPTSKD